MGTVRQLLRGSSEIDRMRSEIFQITKMLVGLLSLSRFPRHAPPIKKEFKGASSVWEFLHKPSLGRTEIVCFVGVKNMQSIFAAHVRIPEEPNHVSYCISEHISAVHRSLPDFVEGMRTAFPRLEHQLKPFLDAGKNY